MTMTAAMYGAPSIPTAPPENHDPPWIGNPVIPGGYPVTPAKPQPLTERQAEAIKRMLETQDNKRLIRVVVWDDAGKLKLKISVDGVVISESETDGNSLAVETKL